MDLSNNKDDNLNHITLTYLTNPIYHHGVNKINDYSQISKQDKRFYRKRITALTKNMLKGEYPSDNLKIIHDNYINALILHFKMQDKSDIIQNDYVNEFDENYDVDNINDNDFLNDISSTFITIDEANLSIGKKTKKNFDKFVTVKK